MDSLSLASPTALPTDLAALPELLAYTQSLGLELTLKRFQPEYLRDGNPAAAAEP